MTTSSALENILSELNNPNLFSDEREALEQMAALLIAQWTHEVEHPELQKKAA